MLLALVAGGAQAASMAWPWVSQSGFFSRLGLRTGQPVWWLQLLALGVLAWLLEGRRSQRGETGCWRQGALFGGLFGTAWMGCTVWWTFVAMHTYGGLPLLLAALAVLVLAGLLGLYYAAACGLFVVMAPASRAWAALVFTLLWLLAELARGTWLTGFGWGAAGYAHVDGPLAELAPWLGVYGLCAVSAWLAMTGAQTLRPLFTVTVSDGPVWSGQVARLFVAGLMLTLPLTMPQVSTDASQSSGVLSVTLLQGNIPQDEKFESGTGVPLALQWYAEQLQNSRTALVIAPETAIPVLPQQLPASYWVGLQQRFGSGQQAALIGTPMGDSQQGYTNSVLGLKPGQTQPWRYDKQHLVPFGEFIPPLFRWFTDMMNIPLGDFNRGALRQPPFVWQGQKLAANICVEDLFGEELAQSFRDPAQAPTIFVNTSNLAWFGNSLAMDQHLQIARMRALEFGRPFVLATNTGVTAIVDHRGRVVAALSPDRRAVLVGAVEGRTGVTPYAWWVARFGLWPFWLLAVAIVWVAARGRWQKR
jgi:apolipoprotein N-acyltransferase